MDSLLKRNTPSKRKTEARMNSLSDKIRRRLDLNNSPEKKVQRYHFLCKTSRDRRSVAVTAF